MIGNPINIALSGLRAADAKISVSARNIANIRSTSQRSEDGTIINEPFQPDYVSQTALSTGGVYATIEKSNREPFVQFEPNNPNADVDGLVRYPNINLEEEIVNQIIASHEFRANLLTIQRANEIQDSALDILS